VGERTPSLAEPAWCLGNPVPCFGKPSSRNNEDYMEEYIREFIPAGRIVYHWFDAYDIEEGRM